MNEIEIDLGRATIEDFYSIAKPKMNAMDLLAFANKVVVGGINHLPMTDLPKVLTNLMKELQANLELVEMAVNSYLNQLRDDE